MGRKFIDCRNYPDDARCSLALSADSEEELLEAVVRHGVAVHGYTDSPELREQLRMGIREGMPQE